MVYCEGAVFYSSVFNIAYRNAHPRVRGFSDTQPLICSFLVTPLVQLPSQRLCSGTLVVDLHIYGPRFTEQPFFLPRSVRSGRSVFSLFSILVTHLPQWQLFVNYLHLPYCNFRPSHFAAPLLSSLKMRVTLPFPPTHTLDHGQSSHSFATLQQCKVSPR